jgi:hypothetical protein
MQCLWRTQLMMMHSRKAPEVGFSPEPMCESGGQAHFELCLARGVASHHSPRSNSQPPGGCSNCRMRQHGIPGGSSELYEGNVQACAE